jgi:hypothetical protein
VAADLSGDEALMSANNFTTFLAASNAAHWSRLRDAGAPSVPVRTEISPSAEFAAAQPVAPDTIDVEVNAKKVLTLLSRQQTKALPVKALGEELLLGGDALNPIMKYLEGAGMIEHRSHHEIGLTDFASDALEVFHIA